MKHVAGITIGLVLGFVTVASAAETMLHSGTAVAVDRDAGTIAIDEVSPGRVGKTRITMRVTPHTMFTAARRGGDGRDWVGGFVETSLPEWTIELGDSVTVLCEHEAPFPTALEIWVATDGYELP